jgi:hypothetical protein
VVVTGAASTAAGTATSLGVGGLPARFVSLAVGTALGFGFKKRMKTPNMAPSATRVGYAQNMSSSNWTRPRCPYSRLRSDATSTTSCAPPGRLH